jgi:hypothetical protein
MAFDIDVESVGRDILEIFDELQSRVLMFKSLNLRKGYFSCISRECSELQRERDRTPARAAAKRAWQKKDAQEQINAMYLAGKRPLKWGKRWKMAESIYGDIVSAPIIRHEPKRTYQQRKTEQERINDRFMAGERPKRMGKRWRIAAALANGSFGDNL